MVVSAYISDVVAKQVRRDNAIKVIRETAGALKGSKTWGETPEEVLANLRRCATSGNALDLGGSG